MPNSGWPVLVLFWLSLAGGAVPSAAVAGSPPSAESAAPGTQPAAPNSVQALDYSILPGGRILIRLVFKQGLREPPAVFASHHPVARIVLDFANTVSELGKRPVEIGQRGLRNLQVVQAGTRTRLIINLARPLVHETAFKGRELLITLQRREVLGPGDARKRFSEDAPAVSGHRVGELRFERGPTGEGRIIVDLSDAAVPIEVRQQGATLIVDFADSALAPELERRLDVRDFGTAVQVIEVRRLGNHVRMMIELAATAPYSVYQVSRHLVVSSR